MDSRLQIGPVIPTPDATARAPWNISSINPHRLIELSPVATAESIQVQLLCLFVFWLLEGQELSVWMESFCASVAMRHKIWSKSSQTQTHHSWKCLQSCGPRSSNMAFIHFQNSIIRERHDWMNEWMNERMNENILSYASLLRSFSIGPEWRQERSANPYICSCSTIYCWLGLYRLVTGAIVNLTVEFIFMCVKFSLEHVWFFFCMCDFCGQYVDITLFNKNVCSC